MTATLVCATLGQDGILRHARRQMRAALGRGGISTTKQEGDGATPAGLLALRRVLYRADRLTRPPVTHLPREPIAPSDGWCDDPASTDYNRAITLPHSARHESLFRSDGIYDVVGVLGWNDAPVQRNRGSAIFLHVASPGHSPTTGCVALDLPDLLAVLADGLDAIDIQAT